MPWADTASIVAKSTLHMIYPLQANATGATGSITQIEQFGFGVFITHLLRSGQQVSCPTHVAHMSEADAEVVRTAGAAIGNRTPVPVVRFSNILRQTIALVVDVSQIDLCLKTAERRRLDEKMRGFIALVEFVQMTCCFEMDARQVSAPGCRGDGFRRAPHAEATPPIQLRSTR